MIADNSISKYQNDLKEENREKETDRKYDENNSEEDNGLAQGEPDTFSDDGYKID